MGRFWVIVAMGVGLAASLAFGVGWLLRQRGRQAAAAKKTLMMAVAGACLAILWLLVGGLQLLWHERRNQPVTVEDLRILEKADSFLRDESAWNRKDDRQCDDDQAKGKWSLSCALDVACIQVLGQYDHTRAALQEVRFVVEEVTVGRQFEGRLMGFNNLPETSFQDVKRVLQVARERVQERLSEGAPHARPVDEPEVSGTVVDHAGSRRLVGGRPWIRAALRLPSCCTRMTTPWIRLKTRSSTMRRCGRQGSPRKCTCVWGSA